MHEVSPVGEWGTNVMKYVLKEATHADMQWQCLIIRRVCDGVID